MDATAAFPHARVGAGMYESFYLRAVSPHEPVGVWIRHTVHKAPAQPPTGSVWCTVFDVRRGAPWMHKTSTAELSVPVEGWIEIGESSMGPRGARGSCGAARWELAISSAEPALRHLAPAWLYRAPAAAHQADEPGAGGELRRRARAGGTRPDRVARLARHGRAQLGRRARRALDLAARHRLRAGLDGVARSRDRARRAGRTDDAMARQRRDLTRRTQTPSRRDPRARRARGRDGARRARRATRSGAGPR